MLGNIGPLEIVVVLIIALIVFGPKRLPELGNSLGKGIREFKDSVTGDHDDDGDDDAKTIAAANVTTTPVQPPEATATPVEQPAATPVEKPAEPEAVPDKHA
jgi:sec-independent protein translocase protein TatA